MGAPRKYPDELRECAVRLYRESGSVGDSFDNALAENLWWTLKIELLYWAATSYATRADAEAAIFRYTDGWYNPRRIQQGLAGGMSPDEYEQNYYTNHPAEPTTIRPEPAAS